MQSGTEHPADNGRVSWYPSKVDWWLAVILAATPVVMLVATLLGPEDGRWAGLVGTLVIAAVYLGLVFPTRYGIDRTQLTIRHGLFTKRIELARITEVTPTRSPLSSPALSLDRLKIRWGEGLFGAVMISPARRREFLSELAAKAGLTRDGERLVR